VIDLQIVSTDQHLGDGMWKDASKMIWRYPNSWLVYSGKPQTWMMNGLPLQETLTKWDLN